MLIFEYVFIFIIIKLIYLGMNIYYYVLKFILLQKRKLKWVSLQWKDENSNVVSWF